MLPLLLTGCAIAGPAIIDRDPAPVPPPVTERQPPPLEPSVRVEPAPQPAAPAPRTDVATLALLEQSDRAVQSGNLDEAIAYVERALRVNGQDVDLWLRLAELQLAANRAGTAEQLAQRAIALSGDRVDRQRRGWLLVADAKEAQGQHADAERIRAQWHTYRG
jgi:tetratricopeptide (TPR) repeat protein